MNRLKEFDFFILDTVYQRISNCIQTIFGWNCFTLAKICTIMSFFFCEAQRMGFGNVTTKSHQLLSALVWCVIYCWIYFLILQNESSYKEGFRNIKRIEDKFLRILLILGLILSVFHPYNVLDICDQFFYTSIFYFYACDPMSPQKSLVQKLIESILPQPELATNN